MLDDIRDLADIDADVNHFNEIYPELINQNNSKYYSIGDINNVNTDDAGDLSVINLNIRSLAAHYDELLSMLEGIKCKFSIICLTESWLSNSTRDLYAIEGYNAFHSLRDGGRRGGGVTVFVKSKFTATVLPAASLQADYIESLFLKIATGVKTVTLGAVYRPPSAPNQPV